MKKTIYTIKEKPTKIWRNNIALILEGNKKPEEMNWTKEQIFEYKYNNEHEYLTSDTYYDKKVLEEFPEYLAKWKTIITNTGLIAFYNPETTTNDDGEEINVNNNFVIYDLFDHDDSDVYQVDSLLEYIEPDISMLLQYNMFDQPLNVRKIIILALII